jgi:hypothetical protein
MTSKRAAPTFLASKGLIPFLLCVLLCGCDGCSSNTATPENSPAESRVPEQERDAGDGVFSMFEPGAGPFDGRIYLTAGKPDFANQYPATVMIATGGLLAATECSGVLLTPRLVLTAANCVCEKREITSSEGRRATLSDSSACAKRAYVTTIGYGEAINEFMAHMQVQPYSGVVRPHPEFKLLLDEQQSVVAQHADLAIIALQVPVESKIRPVSLSDTEARAEERLTMTGYGYGKKFGHIFGLRFIRSDKVLRRAASGADRFLYEQQGTFLYDGFNGGPCFREERGASKLVGIASLGTEEELTFTSTYFYRDWLDSELQQFTRQEQSPNDLP